MTVEPTPHELESSFRSAFTMPQLSVTAISTTTDSRLHATVLLTSPNKASEVWPIEITLVEDIHHPQDT